MRKGVAILVFFCSCLAGVSQQDVTTVGVMVKPIVPSNLFRAGDVSLISDRENIKLGMNQQLGYSLGMVLRFGITKNWTFETGLTYVKRRFLLSVENTENGYSESVGYGIVGYELPITALLNIRLGDQIFMNTAFGGVVDMYPSNVEASTYTDSQSDYFYMLALRRGWIQFSLAANIGWEYRTKTKGTWYLGGAYHRPFIPMYRAKISYDTDGYTDATYANISGNYLTIDLRYFFHEDPEKRKTLQQRKQEREKKKKEEEIFYRPGIDGKKQ